MFTQNDLFSTVGCAINEGLAKEVPAAFKALI